MRATPTSTVVPPELQTNILGCLTHNEEDLRILWTEVRNVSTAFRSMVDNLVRMKQLSNTYIHYDNLGCIFLEDSDDSTVDEKVDLSTKFSFDRISAENPDIAIFKADVADEYKKDVKSALKIHAGVKRKDKEQDIYRPPHKIFIHGAVNDTELPNYSVDLETFELSFDWKAMYTAFWYEEKLMSTLTNNYVGSVKARRDALPSEAEVTPEFMWSVLMGFGKSLEDSRKKARRSRIKRQCVREGLEYSEVFLEECCDELPRLARLKGSCW